MTPVLSMPSMVVEGLPVLSDGTEVILVLSILTTAVAGLRVLTDRTGVVSVLSVPGVDSLA